MLSAVTFGSMGKDVDIGYLRNSQRGDVLIDIRPRTNALEFHTGLLFWQSKKKQMLDGAASENPQDSSGCSQPSHTNNWPEEGFPSHLKHPAAWPSPVPSLRVHFPFVLTQ